MEYKCSECGNAFKQKEDSFSFVCDSCIAQMWKEGRLSFGSSYEPPRDRYVLMSEFQEKILQLEKEINLLKDK